jgi:hypothetical protein
LADCSRRGVGRAGRRHDDVAAPALLAVLGLADHRGHLPAGRIGLQPHGLAAGQDGDVGQVQHRLDGERARIALGPQQAGIAAAGLALDAGGRRRVVLVQLDAQRQRERLPALVLPVPLQLGDAGIVVDRGIGVGRLVAVLGGVDAARPVHLPQPLGLVVVGREVGKLDRPGRRDAAAVLRLLEVALAQPHQRRAVEGGVAADPVVGVGRERVTVLVVPLLLGAVAVLDEHRLGTPVLRFARQVLAALEDQDRLAGRRQPLRQRRPARAGADDDDVEVSGHAALLGEGAASYRPG